jgi:hypothetical protein
MVRHENSVFAISVLTGLADKRLLQRFECIDDRQWHFPMEAARIKYVLLHQLHISDAAVRLHGALYDRDESVGLSRQAILFSVRVLGRKPLNGTVGEGMQVCAVRRYNSIVEAND